MTTNTTTLRRHEEMTFAETAAAIGVSEGTIVRYVRRGLLKTVHRGVKYRRITTAELERFRAGNCEVVS